MILLLLLLLAGCDDPAPLPATPPPAPRMQTSEAPMQPMDPGTPDPVAEEPRPVIRIEPSEVARQRWLDEPFRCRAISTTRYRRCRFALQDDGRVRVRFPLNSVTCDDVVFDAEGDPSELNDCHSSWLRLPENNPLTPARGPRPAWAGSTRGWRWRSDGETYCCPGLWIMAPADR